MTILAVDPGTTESGYCLLVDGKPVKFGKLPNEQICEMLEDQQISNSVIEMIACYGMPVGTSTLETCVWIGRFMQAWEAAHSCLAYRMLRLEVRQEICHNGKAKDAHIRQAMIDMFGPPGTKKHPGILYGMSGDAWQALALGVAWQRKHGGKEG